MAKKMVSKKPIPIDLTGPESTGKSLIVITLLKE